MTIGNRIKRLRIDHNETQAEIAKILNTEQSYYAKYENGKRPLPTEKLVALCQHYSVSADYILGLPQGLDWPE